MNGPTDYFLFQRIYIFFPPSLIRRPPGCLAFPLTDIYGSLVGLGVKYEGWGEVNYGRLYPWCLPWYSHVPPTRVTLKKITRGHTLSSPPPPSPVLTDASSHCTCPISNASCLCCTILHHLLHIFSHIFSSFVLSHTSLLLHVIVLPACTLYFLPALEISNQILVTFEFWYGNFLIIYPEGKMWLFFGRKKKFRSFPQLKKKIKRIKS